MDQPIDIKILTKGYKELHGIFCTLGSIYWNVDVFDYKYHKLIRFLLFFASISCFIIAYILSYSSVISIQKKDLDGMADSVGFSLIFLGLSFVIINGYWHTKNFDLFYFNVGLGYYKYQGERSREKVIKKFKEKCDKKLFFMIKPFIVVVYFITIICSVILPLIHYLNGREVDLTVTKVMYPPLELYFPFNPHTRLGYGLVIVFFAVMCFIVNPQIWGMDFAYIIILSSLTTQWKILNYSVSKIPQRALERYIDKYGTPEYQKDIYQDDRYQDCIYACLVENIKHHQAIVKVKDIISSYLSYVFLIVILNSSLMLASNGMVLVDVKLDYAFMKYVCILTAVMTHSAFFCYFGQELTVESGKVFHTIYSIPWYKCNIKVRKAQRMLMQNTMEPMVERAAFLGVKASMETFNSILSSSYTYINLLRRNA